MTPHGGLWHKLIRFGFRLLYNEFAFTYDTVSYAVSLGAWRCWQRAALKHLGVPVPAPVLELAHGTGSLQLDLAALGYRAVGIDISKSMGRIAARKLRGYGFAPQLARAQAQYLPFAAETFAAVICTFPTEFIFQPQVLREAHRVLQPSGRLVIVPIALLNGHGPLEAGLERLYQITGQRSSGQADVAALFSSCGFSVELLQDFCPRSTVQIIAAHKQT